uniref:Gamma-aminobutyric acid receptor subunit pi n=1 Tax=Junco hyemalis TaxID=40217 RepID=A0A8C5JW72_JUNHY
MQFGKFLQNVLQGAKEGFQCFACEIRALPAAEILPKVFLHFSVLCSFLLNCLERFTDLILIYLYKHSVNYSAHIPPGIMLCFHQSSGIQHRLPFYDNFDFLFQDYTATIFLRQRWTDERLCFDGNKSLSLDGRLVEMLWVPDTFIVDSKKSFLHDVTVENRLIRIYPNGTVLYAIRITTTVSCSMDLTKYPMDKQTCTLQLESWGYNINDVMFYWTRGNDSVRGLDTLQLAQYTVEDHFTSVSEAVYETGRYPKLVFHFELKRNILYFILETYVPSILLVVLSWVSFWISQSSVPARICIGVTTVLTMTTLMMGARTSLPNANCFIKAIDVYLGICFSFIFGALLEYAVTHFCTLHQLTSLDLFPFIWSRYSCLQMGWTWELVDFKNVHGSTWRYSCKMRKESVVMNLMTKRNCLSCQAFFLPSAGPQE